MPKLLSEHFGQKKLDEIVDYFDYLHYRWKDEKDYEYFENYIEAMEKKLGYKIILFTKRPFETRFIIDNIIYYFKVRENNITWGRMG